MAKQAPRFIVQPGWKLRFAAEHVALTFLRTGVDEHHYFTRIDWQSNHAATADIVGVLGRALQ